MKNPIGDNSSESGLFDSIYDTSASQSDRRNPVFVRKLWSTPLATFYTLHRDGKIFLMKTATGHELSHDILRREFELGASVDHPNIVRQYFFEESLPCVGSPGIIMEWVDGETLDRFLERNPSAKTRRMVMEQILQAVACLHSRGIVHNDLKPANILVRYSDQSVRLIDFGLSDDDAHRALRTPGYTDHYAAPELREQRKSDSRSDVYSLGLIMREVMGWRFATLAARCVNPNPDRRFDNAGTLLSAFKRRRYIPLALAAGAVVIIAIIGLVTVTANQRRLENNSAIIEETMGRQNAAMDALAEGHASLQESVNDLSRELAANQFKGDRDREIALLAAREREIFFAGIDSEINRLYNNALDSISAAGFSQFARAIIINYYRSIDALNRAKKAEAAGKSYADEVLPHIVGQMERHSILPTDVQLPSLGDADLSDEEIEFYSRLLLEGKPYSSMP